MEFKKIKNRIVWIDTIKLIACLCVFWSHYVQAFWSCCEAGIEQISPLIQNILTLFGGVLNGDFWVYLFCLISGYFVGKKRISSFKSLVSNFIVRYLRFAIPFLLSGILAWLLSITIGMHTQDSNSFLGESWLQLFYTERITFLDAIKCGLLFDKKCNASIWMMKELFISNLTIYGISYLISMANKKEIISKITFVIILILATVFNRMYFGIGFFGALLSNVEFNSYDRKQKYIFLAFTSMMLIICFFDGFDGLIHKLIEKKCIGLEAASAKESLNAIALFSFIFCFPKLQQILGLDLFERISKLSFPVFLFHWPIMCSMTILMYQRMLKTHTYSQTFVIAFLTLNVVVLIISVCYSLFLSGKINKFIVIINDSLSASLKMK